MEMFSKILDIKGFKVTHIETDETTLFSEAVKTIKNWFESIVNYFIQRTTNGPGYGCAPETDTRRT